MKALPTFLSEADELEKAHSKLLSGKDKHVALGLAMRMNNIDHVDKVAGALAKQHKVNHYVEDTTRVSFEGPYKGIAALRQKLGFNVSYQPHDHEHTSQESTVTHALEHSDYSGNLGGYMSVHTNHNTGETTGHLMVIDNEG